MATGWEGRTNTAKTWMSDGISKVISVIVHLPSAKVIPFKACNHPSYTARSISSSVSLMKKFRLRGIKESVWCQPVMTRRWYFSESIQLIEANTMCLINVRNTAGQFRAEF